MAKSTPPPFPLSKMMDPQADFPVLARELAVVERYDALRDQHPLRAWEYAMAQRAIREWVASTDCWWRADYGSGHAESQLGQNLPPQSVKPVLQICDVGGAGSSFWTVLKSLTDEPVSCIDPEYTGDVSVQGIVVAGQPVCQRHVFGVSVEAYAAEATHGQFDVLTAISVIEHVPDLTPFLRACHMLLRKGGLLFLTTDAWNCEGPDTAHFHWMRRRIYNAGSIVKLRNRLGEIGFKAFGGSDWAYHGNHVYDYTFASIALVKA